MQYFFTQENERVKRLRSKKKKRRVSFSWVSWVGAGCGFKTSSVSVKEDGSAGNGGGLAFLFPLSFPLVDPFGMTVVVASKSYWRPMATQACLGLYTPGDLPAC